MADIPLKNQIIGWLRGQSYWFQVAGNGLLENGEATAELVDEVYLLFKEDFQLQPPAPNRTEVIFVEISVDEATTAQPLTLVAIKDIQNVNALAVGQVIEICPGLTIIYGGNGTGKSGYIRLLNRAFNSRGDKNILPNVFKGGSGTPTCSFTFQASEAPYDLFYPANENNTEFSQFSVFDTHSVRVHLEQDNRLNFTPRGFEFFENLMGLYESIKQKLLVEIASNRPLNTFTSLFNNDNIVRTQIINLGAQTDEASLTALGTFTQTDADSLAALITKREELKALDIPKKIAELQALHASFTDFATKQQALMDRLQNDNIEEYKALIIEFIKFQELATQEGIKSLEGYDIELLGSYDWKEFIKASRGYATQIESHKGHQYPSDGENCIFCLQPLTDKENKLINSYWNLLRSSAEGELNRVAQQIREHEAILAGFTAVGFDETTTIFNYTKSINSELAERWKAIVSYVSVQRQNVRTNLANKNLLLEMVATPYNCNELDVIIAGLKNYIDELFQKNSAKELADLEVQIQFLNDKNLLSKILDKVLIFVRGYKWAAKAEATVTALNTASITRKQGELFNEHITERYTDQFNDECDKLKAPKVVNIVQKNAKMSTLRKLEVGGNIAGSVLSEGEQRAISLSDFITEILLNPANKGVFFDDPVSSQDHERKENIAKRVVELSAQKQVVVFTHDIGFFLRLKGLAEAIGVNHVATTIRKSGDESGIIHPELPWIAQNVKARQGFLRDRLTRLKKLEDAGNVDEYLIEAKTWYGLLREAWERAVEERLFKGVVERFGYGIQTQRLKKVIISDDLLDEIEKGMTDCSKWVHDAAAGLNPTPPTVAKAEEDLNFFAAFILKCVA